jgi:DMSO/TMAO reductase YedYZ heme-binding membrane subunit
MTPLLDVATAVFLTVTVGLVLLNEAEGARWTALRRALGVAWVPLAILFVAKLASVFAPLVRGAWG